MTRARAWTVTCAPDPDDRPVILSIVASAGTPVQVGEGKCATFTLPRTASGDDVIQAATEAAASLRWT